MKKLFVALMALSVVTLGFTSCDKDNGYSADPTTQPIAGKTYRQVEAADAYTQFTFHMNYKCTLETKQAGQSAITNSSYEWYMSPGDTEVVIRFAQGAYDKRTGESLSGKVFLSGEYNATTKTVTLSGTFDGQPIALTLTEVQ